MADRVYVADEGGAYPAVLLSRPGEEVDALVHDTVADVKARVSWDNVFRVPSAADQRSEELLAEGEDAEYVHVRSADLKIALSYLPRYAGLTAVKDRLTEALG